MTVRRIARRGPYITVDGARRAFLDTMFRGESTHCPVCDRYAKIYARKLTSAMAQGLVAMYRSEALEDADGWLYTPPLLQKYAVPRSNDLALLRHWKFIEQKPGERNDGSKRTGWWRLTEEGAEFVEGASARKNVVLDWKGDFLRLEGPWVSIEDALEAPFDFREVMQSVEHRPNS